MLRNRKAQSTLEYAILIFVIVAALIAMQIYIKRGMQGRLRSSTDDIGEQYSPYLTTSNYTTVRDTSTREKVGIPAGGVGVTYRDFEQDKTTRTGSETVDKLANETFPE